MIQSAILYEKSGHKGNKPVSEKKILDPISSVILISSIVIKWFWKLSNLNCTTRPLNTWCLFFFYIKRSIFQFKPKHAFHLTLFFLRWTKKKVYRQEIDLFIRADSNIQEYHVSFFTTSTAHWNQRVKKQKMYRVGWKTYKKNRVTIYWSDAKTN